MNRPIILAVAGVLTLTACGADAASDAASPSISPSAATSAVSSAPSTSPDGSTASADVPPATSASTSSAPETTGDTLATEEDVVLFDASGEGVGTVVQHADGTRTVTSAWGEVTVPAAPQRVVSVLGYIDFESMLAVGVTPIAAGTQGGSIGSGFAPHLADRVASVEPLPWTDGAPIETIAAMEPDLVFATSEEEVDLLSNVAPSVPAGHWSQDWRTNLRYVAAVLGRVDEADALLTDFDARVADLSARLAPVWEGKTVASPQVAFDHSAVYVDTDPSFSVEILDELGATHAPIVVDAEPDSWSIELSMEELDRIDADILFWQVRQRDEDGLPDLDGLDAATSNPLWDGLPAVRNDMVFEVDNRPWYFATVLAADEILDDVESALLG